MTRQDFPEPNPDLQWLVLWLWLLVHSVGLFATWLSLVSGGQIFITDAAAAAAAAFALVVDDNASSHDPGQQPALPGGLLNTPSLLVLQYSRGHHAVRLSHGCCCHFLPDRLGRFLVGHFVLGQFCGNHMQCPCFNMCGFFLLFFWTRLCHNYCVGCLLHLGGRLVVITAAAAAVVGGRH